MNIDLVHSLPAAPVWAQLIGKATLVLALGWLIHAALSHANPRWRVLLWRVVAVGLVLLPVSMWGPSIEFKVVRPAAIAIEPVPQPVANPDAPRSASKVDAIRVTGGEAARIAAQPVMTTPERGFNFRIPVAVVVSWLWAMGVAAIALRCAVGWRRLRTIARQAAPAPDELTNVAARVAWDLGCRGLDLRLTEGISIPFVMGWRRPVLLLPARMAGESYHDQLPAILAHEFSHLRGGDMFWSHALAFVRMLLWFHPFIWKVPAAHAAACEEVSDAISAAYIGDAGAYSRTLARVAVELAELPPPVGGIAMARVPEVMRRLECLRRHVFATSISRQYLAAFVLAFMIGALLIGSLRFAYAQAPLAAAKQNAAPSPPASKQSVRMEGVVVDAKTGAPIKGAKVMWMIDRFIKGSVVSGDDGRFVLAAVDKGEGAIAATAPLHAPEIVPIDAHPGANPVRIALGPGHVIEGRVIDSDGKPAAKVPIYPHTWRNVSHVFDQADCWFVWTDAQGRFRWTEAPDEPVLASVGGIRYICDTKYPLVPDRELSITVRKLLTVSGQVTDAETGQPIKSFKVVPGNVWRFSTTDWWRNEAATGKDGRYELKIDRDSPGYQVEVSADGYQPVATREFRYEAGGVVCDAKLKKDGAGEVRLADSAGRPVATYEKLPESKVEGRVFDANGRAHMNLEIFMCSPDAFVTVSNGKATTGGGWTAHLYSDDKGHFEMTAPFYAPYEFVIASEWGYANVNDRELRMNPEIRLKAWGKIEGTLTVAGKPAAGVFLRIKYDRPFCDASDPNRPKVWFDECAQTDASGKFVFERLMAGPVRIVGDGVDQKLEVKSGAGVRVEIGK